MRHLHILWRWYLPKILVPGCGFRVVVTLTSFDLSENRCPYLHMLFTQHLFLLRNYFWDSVRGILTLLVMQGTRNFLFRSMHDVCCSITVCIDNQTVLCPEGWYNSCGGYLQP